MSFDVFDLDRLVEGLELEWFVGNLLVAVVAVVAAVEEGSIEEYRSRCCCNSVKIASGKCCAWANFLRANYFIETQYFVVTCGLDVKDQ